MSNLAVRRNRGEMVPSFEQAWDPWRMMRELVGWDPLRGAAPFVPDRNWTSAFAPAFEVKETEDNYIFKADMPGVKEKDLEITLTGNCLKISGKREAEKEEKSETYYAYERSYGSFTRTFTLPEGTDSEHVQAQLNDGVLMLALPKKPEAQTKKIEIQGAAKTKA